MEQTVAFSLRAVNGWRGPGALAIAVAHFAVATDAIQARTLQPIALVVDLFFVLSGILIAQVYMGRLNDPSAIPEYIVRRFGRIWPVHAATLGVLVAYELTKLAIEVTTGKHFTSPAFALDGTNTFRSIWTNLLLIHSFGLHGRETWNFPSWSLSVEFVTYIVFSLYCLLSPTRRRFLTVATIVASLAILGLVAPQHMRSTFDYGVFRCLAGFFAGTLLYEALTQWRLPAWPLPTLVEGMTLGLVGVWMIYSPGTLFVLLAPLVFCVFVAVFSQGRGLISRILSVGPLQSFAELSFAIYMVHAVVLILLLAVLHELQRHLAVPLFVLQPGDEHVEFLRLGSRWAELGLWTGYLLAVFAGAYAAFRIVEVPGREFFGRLAKTWLNGTWLTGTSLTKRWLTKNSLKKNWLTRRTDAPLGPPHNVLEQADPTP